MINVLKKSECSGCSACVFSCPVNCISMELDGEGFLYPKIDEQVCIECGKCEKVCQTINPLEPNNIGKAYAVYNKDETIRLSSSSGGVFSLLAEAVINQNGCVFGAAFDDNFNVSHIEIDNVNELSLLRGSKYLQSNVNDSYVKVKERLDEGSTVLFTGTPCQVNGLLHYLPKKYDNLFTQDIICHGVPSYKVWRYYLDFISFYKNQSIDSHILPSFRNKNFGWKKFSVKINLENGQELIEPLNENLFMKAFLKNLCLRPSCYNCSSKGLNRNSDITLADFWGVEKKCPEMFDDKGTSLVFINSEKGKHLFDKISYSIEKKEVDIYYSVEETNTAVNSSVERTFARDHFMKNINEKNFDKMVKKHTDPSIAYRIIRRLTMFFRGKRK